MPVACARNAVVVLTLVACGLPVVSAASRDAATLCTEAAARAADATGVPYDVLLAISVVETGRDGRPWPWTVNLGGEGHWLDAAGTAETLVQRAVEEGQTNIDLGCFQLNYRWHGQAFASVAAMLDPEANARYAAEYLLHHYDRTGDWPTAAAAYHSATPQHAEAYRARFESVLAGGDGMAYAPGAPTAAVDRLNRFPLLLAGQSRSWGSLVPDTGGGQRLIGGPEG